MKLSAGLTALALFSISPLSGVEIAVDFSHDTLGAFAALPGARLAIEAAASDLSGFLTGTPGALENDFLRSAGGASVEFGWSLNYHNPFTDAVETLDPANISAGEIRIFAGLRNINSAEQSSVLGEGGPGGLGLQISHGGNPSGLVAATAAAAAASNAVMLRGEGPTLATFSGTTTRGAVSATYEVGLGLAIGQLWFDQDTNNDGVTDSAAELADYWHFDHTTGVEDGKFDLYTVALHEMLHAIGFGGSESWDDLVSGTNWLGTQVTTLLGTGTNILANAAHVRSSFLTLNSMGALQESIMTPNISPGQRQYLTELDLAFLRDIGWTTASIPEPSVLAFLAASATALALARWRKRRNRR